MEGVEHGDGVGQLVADRVGIATERVQGGMLDGDLHVHAVFGEPSAQTFLERPWTASSSRACRQPCSSRVRSTVTVTALSVLVIFEGRQMCSSTPMVLMPLSRSGSAILVCASALIAD